MLGLPVHQLSASKEISYILNKYSHAILHNYIHLQNDDWERTSFITDSIYIDLEKIILTHSSLGNNEFRTETETGHGTTNPTNQHLF